MIQLTEQQNLEEVLQSVVNHILMEVAYAIERQVIENIKTMFNRATTFLNQVTIDDSKINEGMVFVVVEGQSPEGFDVAIALEFGTGLYGPKKKLITAKHLTPTSMKGFMKFKAADMPVQKEAIPGNIAFKREGFIFTQHTRGIEPKLFMTRAVESVMQKQNEITKSVLALYGLEGMSI